MQRSPSQDADRGGPSRRASQAAWIGSVLEYYDFFIYGTAAALVFSKVFFPSSNPTTGTLLSLATYGVGYVVRPIGAVVLGNLGDRVGRRSVLIATVVLMGTATFLVGCLPSYASIGIAAPLLLVALRLLQGFFAGGEQAGASSITLEHAPDNRRAFFTSFTLSGTQGGQAIATAIFLAVAVLPDSALNSWGWRIPFWASAIVTVVAVILRRKLDETPEFEAEKAANEIERIPIVVLLRDHWRGVLRVTFAAVIATPSTVFTVYALSYGVDTVGLSKTPLLWVALMANVFAIFVIPYWARLSDRVGRKPVFITGSIGSAIMSFLFLWSLSSGHYVPIFITGILMFGFVYTLTSAVWPATYAEMFPTTVRYSGVALGTQLGFAFAGFTPSIIATAASGHGAWLVAAAITAGLCLINVIAISTAAETYRVPTSELGLAPVRVEARRADTRSAAARSQAI